MSREKLEDIFYFFGAGFAVEIISARHSEPLREGGVRIWRSEPLRTGFRPRPERQDRVLDRQDSSGSKPQRFPHPTPGETEATGSGFRK